MKLDNDTRYDSRVLRAIMHAVHAHEVGMGQGRLPTWPQLTVRVGYRRRQDDATYSGYAYYHGRFARLSVPRTGVLDVARFAAVFRHELWHLYGIRHADYPPTLRAAKVDEPALAVAARFGAELLEAPEPVVDKEAIKVAKIERDLARAEARMKAWATKLRRAQTGLKKAARDAKRAQAKLQRAAGRTTK